MATFTDIYKKELKSKGILSSLGSAAFKRTRERLDPRNMLFGGSGMIAATGQKIFGKGYSAIKDTSTSSKLSDGATLQSGALSELLTSSQRQESQLSIIAKNTMNNNGMARDMNVTRQNIMKLVTLQGGKASRGADMFFKDKAAREAQYESQFKRSLPTTATPEAKKESSSGFFDKFLTALGPLGAAVAAMVSIIKNGIGTITDFFGKISSFLPLMTTILDGLKNLASTIGSVITSPLGLLSAGLAAAGVAIYKFSDTLLKRAEEKGGEKGRELESQMQTEMMQGAMDPMGTSFVTGTNPYTGEKLLTPDDERIKKAQIEHQNKINAERMDGYKSRAGTGRETAPTRVDDTGRSNAEKYLGQSISDGEWDMLTRAVYAESSRNEKEYANVMAVILNRSRKSGKSITEVLNERNQFQAVTGTKDNPGPSQMFRSGPDDKARGLIAKSTESLEGISKNMDAFTAANRAAYGKGTNVGWLDKMLSSGGQQIGQTVFAENMYRPATTGTAINTGSTTMASLNREAGVPQTPNITVTAPASPQKSEQPITIAAADVMDTEFGRLLATRMY